MRPTPHKHQKVIGGRALGVGTLAALAVLLLPSCETPHITQASGAIIEPLPLGRSDLAETRHTYFVARGLSHHTIRRSSPSEPREHWVLRSPPLRSENEASSFEACVAREASGDWETETYGYPGRPDLIYRILNTGAFTSLEAVRSSGVYAGLTACGFKPQNVQYTPQSDNGPWNVNILELDPTQFAGSLRIDLARGEIAGLEPVAAIAERAGALAAVNASFFVMHAADGIVGDVAGLSVIEGRIRSEALNGRAALVVANKPDVTVSIEDLTAPVALAFPDGTQIAADGINRAPGLTRNCGNDGDHPTSIAMHDVTCRDDGEIIILDSKAGFEPDPSVPFRVFVNALGLVSDRGPAGGMADEGFVVIATGERADELAALLKPGQSVEIQTAFRSSQSDVFAINGAPLLLRDGAPIDRAHLEGWPLDDQTPLALADEIHQWINLRAPRTAVGIRGDGHILFVTIDGRQGEVSVGATIAELRDVMRALGAVDALNLDGGGSTTLVVDGRLVNSPSDLSGPRPVADAVLLLGQSN